VGVPRTWSWKLADVFGIRVSVHASFLLLLAWVVVGLSLAERRVAPVASGVALVLALFGCVLLHEFGHALAARRYGVATRDITLLPIGGIARLARAPEHPQQAFWVALAGPAVNIVIAIGLFALLRLAGQPAPSVRVGLTEGGFFERLLVANVSLALFNLLPAFPMDGGQALRALLATKLDHLRATRIAATLGQALAVAMAIVAGFGNPLLLLVALFVWLGATAETMAVSVKSALGGIPVARVMLTDFRTLAPDDSLAAVVDLVLHGPRHDFLVERNGQIAGVLTHGDLLRTLAAHGPHARVEAAMQRAMETVDPHDALDRVLARLDARGCSVGVVADGGRVVGLVTTDAIAEFLKIEAAVRHAPA